MTHSERDETLRSQARFKRVQLFIDELLDDGLTIEDVADLLDRGLAAARFELGHENEGGD